MAEPLAQKSSGWKPEPPDISHLIMEDNEPVDGTFSERQMRLLVDALYDSWHPGSPFVAQANVGVFYSIHEPAIVPDVLVSLEVHQRQDVFDRGRSYLTWEYGKPPDVVIEIVSNTTGGEEAKLERYRGMRIPYVVIYDPEGHLNARPVRVWGLEHTHYLPMVRPNWFPDLGLGLTTWKGAFQDVDSVWLRWCDSDGNLLWLGNERAEQERARAEQERARAEQERARADKLADHLRALGVDPASL